MGWSWALYFCHSFLAEAMVQSEARRLSWGLTDAREQCLLRDRRAAPRLMGAAALLAPYLDNANLAAASRAVCAAALQALK
eukprot:1121641-Lingulodinium_polyedra.AAC.1